MARIWLINEYSSTPATGHAGRQYYLARELARRGHDVTLVASRWHHKLRGDITDQDLPEEEYVDGFKFVRVKMPRYKNSLDKRRVRNWFLFSWHVSRLDRRLTGRADAVLCSSPSLPVSLGTARLAQRLGARFVFEVRDIWPLTLVEVGGYSPHHPVIRLLQWIEDRAYRRADAVVSNLEGAVEHMASRGMDRNKFTWVSNGISLDEVNAPEPLAPDISAQIPSDGFRVAYVGTLGLANSLETLIDAVAQVTDLPDLHILLVGQGRARYDLEERARRLGVQNLHFLGVVPKAQVQSVLAKVDACYIGWLKSPLYNWGIAANKIPDYLFSGKPIIHGFSGGNDPVTKFEAGLSEPAEDPHALADAIRRLHAMPEAERRRLGENGRRAALEHYDYAKLAEKLERVLLPENEGPKT